MEVYFFTLFILGLFSLYEYMTKGFEGNSGIILGMKIFAFVILVCQVGLRWETGTDWITYKYHFDSLYSNPRWLSHPDKFETLYELWMQFFYKNFQNYSYLLFATAFLNYLLFFRAFTKLLPNFFLGVLLFYAFSIGLLGSERQLLSLGICLNALTFLVNGKKIWFLALVFVGYFFHSSALLFLIYFFLNRNFKIGYILLFLAVCIGIGYTNLPVTIFSLAGGISSSTAHKSTIYINQALEDTTKLSLLGLVKRLLFVTLFIISRKKIQERFPDYKIFLNGYLVGLGFYFLFANSLLVMISRGSLYFNVMEPFLLSFQILAFREKVVNNFVIAGLAVLAYINFNQSIASYPQNFNPYKGIFYNENYFRPIL